VKYFKISPAIIREGLAKPAQEGMIEVGHDVVQSALQTSETRI
jgi:hypothetical protein